MSNPESIKIALALQGSFGHIDYATGILDAFRAHNHAASGRGAPTLDIAAASGCVEMLTPLWLYLADQRAASSMGEIVIDGDNHLSPWARQRMVPPSVRPDAWHSYFFGLGAFQSETFHAFGRTWRFGRSA